MWRVPAIFVKLYALRKALLSAKPDSLLDQEDRRASEVLAERGFSQKLLHTFLHPFYRGIFLEPALQTSIGMFDFTFSMFARGNAAIPAAGMAAIPEQLAHRLGMEHIRLGRKSRPLRRIVRLADGSSIQAEAVLLAVDGWSALLGDKRQKPELAGSTTCVYFASPRAPYKQKLIALKSAPAGIINNIAVMSNVAPDYAPEVQHLISVSVREPQIIEDRALYELVAQELSPWYGAEIFDWKPLAIYRIPYALPDQRSVRSSCPSADFKLEEGLYLAGDHLLNGSIQAALRSGRLAAKAIQE
ncbi:MAG: FAD-dependent oxidoreductase [Bacteroidia bacterium]